MILLLLKDNCCIWDSGSNVAEVIVASSLDPRSKLFKREQNSNVYGSIWVRPLLVSVNVFSFVKLKNADLSSFVMWFPSSSLVMEPQS